MDELSHDQVRRLLVDLAAQEDNSVVEEPRVDVKRALASSCLLDDDGDQRHGDSFAIVQLVGCTVADVQLLSCASHRRRLTMAHDDLHSDATTTTGVTRDLVLPASPEDVWDVITEDGWLAEHVELELEPGGEARFTDPEQVRTGWV